MKVSKISYKVAVPLILAGLFVIVSFMAVEYDQLNLDFYIILSLLSIYLFLFGFATGQHFASPIKKILEGAKALAKGDLSSRVYIETKDELEDLAKIFDELAEDLEKSRAQEAATEKSVDIKVRAQTQDLQGVIYGLEQKVKNRTAELDKMTKELAELQNHLRAEESTAEELKKELSRVKSKPGDGA